jgi:peptidoglycan/xylan/chitin deacetylase (PgdA/CDA1 family)
MRHLIRTTRRATLATGLALAVLAAHAATTPARAAAAPTLPILVYHRLDPARPGPTTVTTPVFEAQLAWLRRHGYQVARLRPLIEGWHHDALPARTVAITADDGHRSIYTQMFPLIRRYGVPVTLFIYPSAISRADYALTWEQLREMQESGLVDVESHTYWHPDFRVERARLGAEAYRRFVDMQLTRSRAVLRAHLGGPVDLLAWPYGITDPSLEQAARSAGYVAAFGYGGGPARATDDLMALPRIIISDRDRGDAFGARLGAPADLAASAP